MSTQSYDYDSPWKEALEIYFEPFMALFFPQAHSEIDWGKGYTFLDKELQKITRKAETGRKYLDKLVRVHRFGVGEAWVLVHIEVQAKPQAEFARRMFVYHYRLFDSYKDRQVVSLAILADDDPTWRPNVFGYELWGCELRLRFPVVKLLDYKERWQELEQSRNPFAAVVMAHLKALETRRAPEQRLQWKIGIVRQLYAKGYTREDILALFRLIDWLLILPDELEKQFDNTISSLEQEDAMPYVTSIERLAIRRTKAEVSRKYIIDLLETRFKHVPDDIREALVEIPDTNEGVERLEVLFKKALAIDSLDDFRKELRVTGM